MIEDSKNGFLVPANDPYQLSFIINKLNSNKELNKNIGINARKTALQRHDKNAIVENLLKTYHELLDKE